METIPPRIEQLEESGTFGKFVVEPLERGYGDTLGNSLRRVLLSSIEGAAVTFVKIDKVLHEFSTIPGVKEDTTELLLNLKGLNIKVASNGTPATEPRTVTVARRGAGRVTGADVDCPDDMEVVNPEVYLATISDEDASLNMELTVELGKGYVLPDKQDRKAGQPIGVIPMGSAFSPVRKVNYSVDATRVGYKTDYERLTLEVTTNGTMSPTDAINRSAAILIRHFEHFLEFGGVALSSLALMGSREPMSSGQQAPDARIEELDFSVRTYNCLKKAQIVTVQELVDTSESELMQIRNFGKRSLVEVRERLGQINLTLKGGPTISTADVEEVDPSDELE